MGSHRHAVWLPREHRGDYDPEWRTTVDATAESDVLHHVWAVEAEFAGLVEPAWIAVCRTVHHKYAGTGLHIEVADPGGALRHAEVDRARKAGHLPQTKQGQKKA